MISVLELLTTARVREAIGYISVPGSSAVPPEPNRRQQASPTGDRVREHPVIFRSKDGASARISRRKTVDALPYTIIPPARS
jgi:hypothetical protein